LYKQRLRTPTGPFFARFFIDIILGLVAEFAFMERSTRLMMSLSAARWMDRERKARSEWLTLKLNTHEGYVSWERFEAIRAMVSSNVPTGRHHGAPKHGDALLAGVIRCKRCGRKLTLRYSGMKHHIPRYSCSRAWMDNGGPHCIGFGGLRVDDAIEEALLGVVGPGAIAADRPDRGSLHGRTFMAD
jgi:Recombinase zinc beta ribbon domain